MSKGQQPRPFEITGPAFERPAVSFASARNRAEARASGLRARRRRSSKRPTWTVLVVLTFGAVGAGLLVASGLWLLLFQGAGSSSALAPLLLVLVAPLWAGFILLSRALKAASLLIRHGGVDRRLRYRIRARR